MLAPCDITDASMLTVLRIDHLRHYTGAANNLVHAGVIAMVLAVTMVMVVVLLMISSSGSTGYGRDGHVLVIGAACSTFEQTLHGYHRR